MHTFSIYRKGTLGTGTFVVCHHKNHFFLLSCCHNFLSKTDKKKAMTYKDLMAKLMCNCKEAKLVFTDSLRHLTAEELPLPLWDSKKPVLCFDRVKGGI